MRTEIDPILKTLSADLSQDSVTIHYWKRGGKESLSFGCAYDGISHAHLVLTTFGDLAEIYLEVEHEEFDGSEWVGSTKTYIELKDVFDVEVDSFGDNPDYEHPPTAYARWLRSRGGYWRRLDLT